MTYKLKQIFGNAFRSKENSHKTKKIMATEIYIPSNAILLNHDEMEYVDGGAEYRGRDAFVQVALMAASVGTNIGIAQLCIWGMGLMATGVLGTIGAAILAVAAAAAIITAVWNIPHVLVALYYTLAYGGFKHESYWFIGMQIHFVERL